MTSEGGHAISRREKKKPKTRASSVQKAGSKKKEAWSTRESGKSFNWKNMSKDGVWEAVMVGEQVDHNWGKTKSHL